MINVAQEIVFIQLHVKEFSSAIRNFRNYTHPCEQLRRSFNPDAETAELCISALKVAISDLCSAVENEKKDVIS